MTDRPPLIGILGGLGPQAGLDMADKLIRLTRTSCDQDHIPFVLFSFPDKVADRTSFLLGHNEVNPAYAIAEQFEKMSDMGVTIAAMACNTAHAAPIFDVVLRLLEEKGIKLRILHMVKETVSRIRSAHPDSQRVGILATQGTYQTGLYEDALDDAGLEAILPDPVVRKENIHAALYAPSIGLKACSGTVTDQAISKVRAAVHHLKDLGAETVILGCTELPLVVKDRQIDGIPILDPARIVVEKLIRQTFPEKLLPPG
jgi:aspartate racemase